MKNLAKISIILSLIAISIIFANAFRKINNFKNGTVSAATVNYSQLVDNSDNYQTSDGLMNLRPTGYVNDYQKLFTPEQRDTLEKMMSEYEMKTSIEFCLVTYWIEPEEYSEFDVFDLGTKWGVGKEGLDNGFLMFLSYSDEAGKSNYFNATGRGLEPFLPDATVNRLNSYILLPKFKTHSTDEIFEGYKEYIIACQEKLGDDGYDMLVENKRIRDEEIKAKTKAFFTGLLKVLFVLVIVFAIGFLIYVRIQKRKKFLRLKSEINRIISDINKLRISLNDGKELPNYPPEEQSKLTTHQKTIINLSKDIYLGTDIIKVTKKMVTEESRKDMQEIYNNLLDYKTTINSIKSSVENIKKYETDVQTYLNDNYPYCVDYLKNELNDISNFVGSKQVEKMLNDDFNMEKRYKLMNIESSLENKLNTFLNKTAKINTIVLDYKNINNKLNDLNNKYSVYVKKKNILAGAKIGKRYDSLVNLKFDKLTVNVLENITDSMNDLESGYLKGAFDKYGEYVTNLAIIGGAFDSVNSLYNTYEKSVNYIKNNKSKISGLVSKVESKSHKSGVSHSQRSDFSNSKSDISKFSKLENVDVILAATLLATILSNLSSIYSKMKSSISSYEYSSSRSTYSSTRIGGGGGGGGFGGFGGGSFGGGGAGGSF